MRLLAKTIQHSKTPHSISIEKEIEKDMAKSKSIEASATTIDDYPHGTRLVAIVISLMLSTFVVALDNTILGTAIPRITDDFHDLNKVSWYGAAYFMTFGGFQSTWGKFYKYFAIKTWFIVAIFIFEVGSLICAVAPNPTTLIVGRAIGGLGGAGIGAGAFTIIGFAAPPEKRPQLLGYTGATYGIAAVLGPLIGGLFADKATWRWYVFLGNSFLQTLPFGHSSLVFPLSLSIWLLGFEFFEFNLQIRTHFIHIFDSRPEILKMEIFPKTLFHVPNQQTFMLIITRCFYINLPLGGLAAAIVFFIFKTPEEAKPAQGSWKEKLLQMDLGGALLVMSLIISYLLAVQYGGQTKPWKSSVVIGLLVGSFSIFLTCIAWEIIQGERAMIVPRLFKKRYLLVGSIFQFFFAGGYLTILYSLPIYFQSVYNASPIESGVKMLALVIPLTLTAIIQGVAFSKIGIAPPFWILGGALGTIACGLFYTMNSQTPTGKWIGYQIIIGFAVGITFQTSTAIAQVNARPEDMSQVTAIIFFSMMMGGSFFVSAAQSAFNNRLIMALTSMAPDINPATALAVGATQIRLAFTPEQVPFVVDAYMAGLKVVFAITIAAFGTSALVGFYGGWKRIHG